MNIFTDATVFWRDIPVDRLSDSYLELFTLAGDIHSRLGSKAYLLDNYLSQLLKVVDQVCASDDLENSMDSRTSLYAICRASCHPDRRIPHPFFAEAHTFILSHPMQFQESETQTCLHFSLLVNGYVTSSIQAYRQQFFDDLAEHFDKSELDHCYNAICAILEDEVPMEKLNLLFQERFLVFPATAVFYRAVNNQLAEALLHRDTETSLQIFQLIMKSDLLNSKKS